MPRSFIEEDRQKVIQENFVVHEELVRGKNILLVDDSIGRGTTARNLIRYLKEHGAKKVHLISTFPPVKNPCILELIFQLMENCFILLLMVIFEKWRVILVLKELSIKQKKD